MNGKQSPGWDGNMISCCLFSVPILLFYLILFMIKSGLNVPYLTEYKNVCMLWLKFSQLPLAVLPIVFPHERVCNLILKMTYFCKVFK